jgi:hypothetical protein
LKGACHASFSAIREFFRDVIGVRISRGMLRKLAGKVSASLEDPYEALCAMLPSEPRLNVDETGHKENGQPLWTWCFRAYLYTVYKISPSRGSGVLVETLGGEFKGVLGCDYVSAHRKYMDDFGVPDCTDDGPSGTTRTKREDRPKALTVVSLRIDPHGVASPCIAETGQDTPARPAGLEPATLSSVEGVS